ncbi:TIGR02677 family protein [Alicyclobacillus mengziensis]|uniref:TIGR02677 family protein n=1 Tax=Alicyclobacillus mengziensis TaxID=2931921 RepID=A0A9X7W2K4_9BACL|nr:TIGR02677 family protein [Alicyclobacillus mengziensis]QSO49195.1 TIGR02677 family protein [Alicyclobacillus mengziensis]
MQRNQARELWVKPVPELKYLNADNVSRYRLIMRYFYENHSKLRYWLKPEEVFSGVMHYGLLDDYTEDQCQRDLEVLTEWKNLTSRHDGGRAQSIEEYLRKRFRYQMTPYAIEIERMLQTLEQLQGYGGSLEPALLERIAGYIAQIRQAEGQFAAGAAHQLWRDLQSAFRQLHESASDYLASLQTARVEELMLTDQFLIFKDTLTQYLRDFVRGLQQYGVHVEAMFRQTPQTVWQSFLMALVEDEKRLPMFDNPLADDERMALHQEEWQVLEQWFVGSATEASDVLYLERQTKDTIARVVRYALAIQERHQVGVSRRRELESLGLRFLELDNPEEAHKLGAYAFGLYQTRHFQGEGDASSDAADFSMWDEKPIVRRLRSRSRGQRKSGGTESIRSTRVQRQEAAKAILEAKKREATLVKTWIDMKHLRMSELPTLSPEQRILLLQWIGRCMVNQSKLARTPDGLEIRLILPENGERTRLQFTDGALEVPDFELFVEEVASS